MPLGHAHIFNEILDIASIKPTHLDMIIDIGFLQLIGCSNELESLVEYELGFTLNISFYYEKLDPNQNRPIYNKDKTSES